MNDRFKFRVFDKETGKYYKSRINKCSGRTLYQHPSSGHCQWVTISTIFAELEQDEKIYTRTGVEPDTIIEQCTGLKDKNGNLIYEGDIVYDSVYENNFVVSWDNDRTGYILSANNTSHIDYLSKILIERHNLKIIGNVHEQPEHKE